MPRYWRNIRYSIWRQKQVISLGGTPSDIVFTKIHQENRWGDVESLSGPGSNLAHTEIIRKALPGMIDKLNCQTILDIPCGDFNWMRMIDINAAYIGGDIVLDLIKKNEEQYGDYKRKFMHLDLTHDELPHAELILCRDCFVHLSNSDILRALVNIKKSKATYLLTTTFVTCMKNEDIPTGFWRPLNLQLPPFEFPEPVLLIDEWVPPDNLKSADKKLGLWKISDIPNFELAKRQR
jgi:hypothetical protein